MSSNISDTAERFLRAFGNSTDLEAATKEFVADCMTLVGVTEGPTSPGSPILSHSSTRTLESDSTVGGEYAVSPQERAWYYHGITSEGDHPDLLYRSNSKADPWVPPTGRHANMPTKSARPAHGTPLAVVWDDVGSLIDDLVFAAVRKGYSIDAARFFTVPHGEADDKGILGPAVVWVTVDPALNISPDTAHRVSEDILALLGRHDVRDAHVEWCEGVTFKLAGPPPVARLGATAQVRRHLTTLLNIPIAPAGMENLDQQGSVGLLFHENKTKDGEKSDKVFAVTNHHVVCRDDDKHYDFRADGSPRQKIRVCSGRRFQQGLNEIRAVVAKHGNNASVLAEEIEAMEENEDEADPRALAKARQARDNHLEDIRELEAFYKQVTANWVDIGFRDIGVLVYSPPISVETDERRYTKDFAIIELDAARFRDYFQGNVVWLGTAFDPSDLNQMINPRNDASTGFKYPPNGRLRIRGSVTKEELANPTSLDTEGEPCIFVMKDGTTTDLTIGRCAGLESFLCGDDGVRSVEVAVYNYDKTTRPFSAKGDSGALIFDCKGGQGRMVALLHSGKAKTGSTATHVTYGTPMWRVREWIEEPYPNADYACEKW